MKILTTLGLLLFMSCAHDYNKTVPYVDLDRFMGKWYVIAGRFTFLENGAHNSVEIYSWNSKEKRIDIDFQFRKGSFNGKLKKIPQKAWIVNEETQAHWEVSPFWPLKFDYFVIDLADDYSWTAIGVPNQKYLWIMSRNWNMSDKKLKEIIQSIKEKGYKVKPFEKVPQNGQ